MARRADGGSLWVANFNGPGQVVLAGGTHDLEWLEPHATDFGGRKVIPIQKMLEKHPDFVVTNAVRGMLPKNRLGRQILTKLKVYAGPDHPHQAQGPKPLELKYRKAEA